MPPETGLHSSDLSMTMGIQAEQSELLSEAWPGRAGTEEQVLEGHIHVQKADLTATGGLGSAYLREPYRGGDRREPCPWASETD